MTRCVLVELNVSMVNLLAPYSQTCNCYILTSMLLGKTYAYICNTQGMDELTQTMETLLYQPQYAIVSSLSLCHPE